MERRDQYFQGLALDLCPWSVWECKCTILKIFHSLLYTFISSHKHNNESRSLQNGLQVSKKSLKRKNDREEKNPLIGVESLLQLGESIFLLYSWKWRRYLCVSFSCLSVHFYLISFFLSELLTHPLPFFIFPLFS